MAYRGRSWQRKLEHSVRAICGTENVLGLFIAADFRQGRSVFRARIGNDLTPNAIAYPPVKTQDHGRPALWINRLPRYFDDTTASLSGAKTCVAFLRNSVAVPRPSSAGNGYVETGDATGPELSMAAGTGLWQEGTVRRDGLPGQVTNPGFENHLLCSSVAVVGSGSVRLGNSYPGAAIDVDSDAVGGPYWFALWLSIELTDVQWAALYRATRLAYRRATDVTYRETAKAAQFLAIAPDAVLVAPLRESRYQYTMAADMTAVNTPLSKWDGLDSYNGGLRADFVGKTLHAEWYWTAIFAVRVLDPTKANGDILCSVGTIVNGIAGFAAYHNQAFGTTILGQKGVTGSVNSGTDWHVMRFTRDATNIRLYCDGALVATNSAGANNYGYLLELGCMTYNNGAWERSNCHFKNFVFCQGGSPDYLSSEQITELEALAATD